MKCYFTLVSVLVSFVCLGQITVDANVDEAQAMETLLGENVTISNLTWSGVGSQIGVFECEDCGLDFEAGVIISTGDVGLAVGPNDQGAAGLNVGVGPVNEVDMTLAEPTNPEFYDLAILEFDFVALGDSIWFDYIWASDEYPNFINEGGINDQFGFFMSGPGINGIYTDGAENLAVIPGTTDAVTNANINNGNLGTNGPCENCEYYVHNGTGAQGEPEFTDDTVTQYDGYTTGLRAIQGGLQCGETYHLKICIADVGDGIYDSAVILKAGSLSSNLTVQVELEIEATNEDGVMNEECGLSTLIFSRPEAIASDLPFTVNILYSGEAENGVDYTLLPEQIEFEPGIDVITFTLDAFEDGIIEGLELVRLDMQSVAVCEGESVPSSFEFYITEASPLDVEGYEVEICQGASIEIEPIINGGSGGFLYEWNTDETTSSIEVSPLTSSTYNVLISDTCIAEAASADITVNVAEFPELTVSSNPGSLDIACDWFGTFMSATASGGDGTYTYEWTNQDDESLSTFSDFFIWQPEQELYVTVTDGCGIEATSEIEINSDVIILDVEVPEEINVCAENLTIEPIIEGNDPITITWYDQFFNILGNDEILELDPTEDMTIQINVNDGCNQFFSQNIQVTIVDPAPLVIEPFVDFDAACEEEVTVPSPVVSGTPIYEFNWETISGLNLGDQDFATLIIEQNEEVIMSVSDACGESAQDTVLITLVQTPLEISVPSNLQGDCLSIFEIEAQVNLAQDVPLVWEGAADLVQVDNYNATYQSFDSATISISGDAGCQNTDSETINISISSPPLVLQSSDDQLICEGESAILSASAEGGSGQYVYEWLSEDVFDSQVTVTPDNSTSYTVQVSDECLNSTTTNSFIEVEQLGVTFSYVQNDFNSFSFTPSVTEDCTNCSYFWEFSDGITSTEVSPSHVFNQIGDFGATLSVTSENGCVTEFTDFIYVPIIYIPNSFTPNNDGLNDAFQVSVLGIQGFKIQIYNRWGEVVYESEDADSVWDGSHKAGDYFCAPGVYNYVITYKSLDTSAKELRGAVTLIR